MLKNKILNFFKKMKKFIKDIPHTLREMVVPSKVTWPTPKETTKRTAAVIAVSGIAAISILLMDTMFSLLLKIPFLF